jgi:hypothetical protein
MTHGHHSSAADATARRERQGCVCSPDRWLHRRKRRPGAGVGGTRARRFWVPRASDAGLAAAPPARRVAPPVGRPPMDWVVGGAEHGRRGAAWWTSQWPNASASCFGCPASCCYWCRTGVAVLALGMHQWPVAAAGVRALESVRSSSLPACHVPRALRAWLDRSDSDPA